MGGIALGKGVTSSGLLEILDDVIRDIIDGKSLYTVVMVLSVIVLVSPAPTKCLSKQLTIFVILFYRSFPHSSATLLRAYS